MKLVGGKRTKLRAIDMRYVCFNSCRPLICPPHFQKHQKQPTHIEPQNRQPNPSIFIILIKYYFLLFSAAQHRNNQDVFSLFLLSLVQFLPGSYFCPWLFEPRTGTRSVCRVDQGQHCRGQARGDGRGDHRRRQGSQRSQRKSVSPLLKRKILSAL